MELENIIQQFIGSISSALTQPVTLYYVFIFIAGSVFGSFFNVVADRSVSGESIFFGRSKCDFCKKPLTVKNLFPVVSYLLQKGRCDNCKEKLSVYYPLSEILSGIIFVVAAYFSHVFEQYQFETLTIFLYFATVLSFYLILFLTDIKYRLLPDKIVFTAIWFVIIFFIGFTSFGLYRYYQALVADDFGRYLLEAGIFKEQILSAAKYFGATILSSFGIALFFLLLIFITKKRGMGGGDVKLGFLIGLVNGYPTNILAIFLGFVIGAVYSLILILFRRKTVKDTIAFGPFLIIGSLVAFFFGSQIINWYMNLMS